MSHLIDQFYLRLTPIGTLIAVCRKKIGLAATELRGLRNRKKG
jgi:hypothetical protein